MHSFLKYIHLLAAIVWLGGASFMFFALRPALGQLPPAQRLPLIADVLSRFFKGVWLAIAALLATGLAMMLAAGMRNAPVGWHAMAALGLLMFALFGHLYFGPFSRLKRAVKAEDWPEGARRVGQIATLAWVNLGLGVLAIAAVLLLH